jgi:hypothetical protein
MQLTCSADKVELVDLDHAGASVVHTIMLSMADRMRPRRIDIVP